ncbi:type II toxin-antitoxin system RelE family toxin [Planktotalea arctica]|jgi:mRNA interferase RelE/StbE|uniref:type II toxin-antitoxin system RelE family toxin n=1 Tax=Planktotalea arctica TaxID=1481893 RepID=UPI000A176062|nr:type II toxin-antitoxin system RelE/ParE family toxin [Planktotalea arctica]
MKEIAYTRTAQKALMRMPRNLALRIREKVRSFAEDPASQANNVKALRGLDGVVRLRVGDWRVIMRDGVIIEILEVKPRGSAYKE